MLSPTIFQQEDLDRLIAGTHWNPRAILGPHCSTIGGKPSVIIRAWLPYAARADVRSDDPAGLLVPMTRLHDAGLFEAIVPAQTTIPSYRLSITQHDGTIVEFHDPYAFPPLLTEFELHLFAEGTLYKAYDRMGAHLRTVEGIPACILPCGHPTPNE